MENTSQVGRCPERGYKICTVIEEPTSLLASIQPEPLKDLLRNLQIEVKILNKLKI